MQDIEQEALQTYQYNLEFLSKNHHDILDKIQSLNSIIENGTLQAKYDLEYLDEYFDVKQLHTSNYLYASNSIETSSTLVEQVNFKKDSFSFEGFPLYYGIEDHVEKMDDKTQGLEGVYPLMSYYLDNSDKSSQMKLIEKFIFIGVGLGLHLIDIDKKISAQEYLIIEDDLELFNLSLFCTKYYELGIKKKLYFSIADDENSFMNVMNSFLEDTFYINRYLKYSYFPAHSDTKIKLIQNALISQDFISFPYKTLLRKYLKPFEYINNDYKIVNFSKHFLHSTFSSKPMLVLGAGPSLHKNIEWLKLHQSRFVIMAVSSTLKTLYTNDIKPDIITHMDGFNSVLDVYKGFDVQEFTKDTIVLFGSFIQSQVREIFPKENCFFTEEDTYYFKDFNSLVGPCIGSTSILYSLMLNTRETYILGTDFAVDAKTGKTHSPEHITKDKHDISTKDELKNIMSFRKNLFAVKGNFTHRVYTNSLYQVSIQALHNRIPIIKRESQSLFNLNDGAAINEAQAQNINEINIAKYTILDKKKLNNEIRSTLSEQSLVDLSQDDESSLKQRLLYSQEIKKYLLEYSNNVSHTNSDKYLYDLLGLVSDILRKQTRETNNIVKIYYLFFKYTIPMIMDLFNTKGLKNEKRHIKKIDKMLVRELMNIESIYENSIDTFLKKSTL